MLIAAAVTFAGQFPALQAGAICFDDQEYFVDNPLVHQPGVASAEQFLKEVLEPSTVHGYYQPLTMISLMLDYAAGARPGHLMPLHRTSLILHAINTAMIVLILYELFGHIWAASIIGILFGLHPMTVETFVWIGERKTLLAAFFALPAIFCYLRYARTRRVGWYIACAALFVLALMSKPTATPLPVCLLLLDFWPLNRFSRKAMVEKIPLLIIAAVSAWITYESQKRTAVTVLPSQGTWWHIPLILCHNIVFYLRRIVWPANTSSHYPLPGVISPGTPAFLIGVIGTLVLLVLLGISLRRTRAAAVGWLYFFIGIFPTMGVIGFTNVIAADKFAYLPSVGLMLPLAALIAWAWDRPKGGGSSAWPGAIAGLGFIAAAGLLWCSRSYIAEWDNTETLFRYMVRLTPNAPTVHHFLGKELADQGREDEAIDEYRFTLQRAPSFYLTHMNLGLLLANERHNQVKEAIEHYYEALKYKPDFYEAHNNLGNALMATGDRAGAIQHYRAAIAVRPRSADAHYNLANALYAVGDAKGAVEQFELTLKIEPSHPQAHQNYGTVLLQLGRRADAVVQYQEALRLRPDWWQVANQLAWILADPATPDVYNLPEALQYAEIACKATGRRDPVALGTLAIMLARSGRTDEAKPIAEEGIRLARARGDERLAGQIEAGLRATPPGSRPAGQ